MSSSAATAFATFPLGMIQSAPRAAVARRARGPLAETWIGIGSAMLKTLISGLRNLIFRRCPSNCHSTISPRNRARTMRTYSCMSASLTGPRPTVLRAVLPVETPKSIRPGARALTEARALAATGAMRFDGISTPVPSRNPPGDHCGRRDADEHVRVEHMRVVEERPRIAQFLRRLTTCRSCEVDAELHARRSFRSRDSPWPPPPWRATCRHRGRRPSCWEPHPART